VFPFNPIQAPSDPEFSVGELQKSINITYSFPLCDTKAFAGPRGADIASGVCEMQYPGMFQFPFTAIVGMEDAKKSLLYHAIDPRIGGALFLGHRGCAKSTLVRSFAEVLRSTSNESAPFVEVPLGTTEDRLLGSVNAEMLVEKRRWTGRTGLIEEAHGGVLYIDEVNLLPDHLADYILDSAASGQYRMERDGITRSVESRYILVGTMNPDEGDLRPQLSDRFAHGILIQDNFSDQQRIEIVKRRIAFDDDPENFVARFSPSMRELGDRVGRARHRITEVEVSDQHRITVAAKARQLKLEGLRAELAVVRTARCAAAWDGRLSVQESDLQEAWRLCLGHRYIDRSGVPKAPSSPPTSPPPSFGNAAKMTSIAPLDARPDSRVLGSFHPRLHDLFLNWVQSGAPDLATGSTSPRNPGVSLRPGNGVAWLETLIFSIRHGWLDTGSLTVLQRRLPSKKPIFWCFLDASRSTGMNQFLDAARNVLAGVPARAISGRFHLLILAGGKIRWAARNASSTAFLAALGKLREASGKSLIIEAITRLHRAKLRKGFSSKDRVLILSDGLASPSPGEDSNRTLDRLRQILRRLAQTGTPSAWLHPSASRGLKRWVPELLRGLPFARFEVSGRGG
jgi:Mg-chelatase subunit ChlI